MRVEVIENGGKRLRLTLRTNVPLYAFFGLLFVAMGVVCIWLLRAEGSPIASTALGLVCVGAGVLILAAIQQVSIIADRESGTLTLSRWTLLRPLERVRQLRLADIVGVRSVPRTLRTGRHIVTSWSVQLLMRGAGGEEEAIGTTFLPMFTENAAAEHAEILGRWLRLR